MNKLREELKINGFIVEYEFSDNNFIYIRAKKNSL